MSTFNYPSYKPKTLTVDQLDNMAKFISEPDGTVGTFKLIVSLIKLALVCFYVLARKNLIDQEIAAAKQLFEQAAAQGQRNNNNI